ncbi:hypothetical protein OPKNFCMD_3823 [Methylobacterium crusticola]|uniref:Uncharacterized protein n=1 Tax=Methylobacterium crusticola TaxID=1697972 RepID=A0ABQ4R069_9HYPH|nr:hypothetical protein [Methylobacterium crusticola]GJD51072.1 hypothetical protein OPKNFCMD_3823 [Methylobacterium crusticola]
MLRHVLLALAILTAPAAAQTFALPEIGLQASGACRQLAVRDRVSTAMVPIGCLDVVGPGFRLTPSGLAMSALPPLDTSSASRLTGRHNPPNAVMLGGGNRISFCPTLSCVDNPSTDHQRATALISAETQDDGHSEEQTLAVLTTVRTGYARPWLTSTAYALGDNVSMQDGRNSVYRVVQAGTSAASGSGPSGKGSSIVDGSVRWAWINDAAINAKAGIYNETQIVAGGGATWGQANNVHLRPGAIPTFAANTELDFANDSGTDCAIGVSNCLGLWLQMVGSNKSTAGALISSSNTTNAAAVWGLRLAGSKLAEDSSLQIDTSGVRAIGIGTFSPGVYSGAAIEIQGQAQAGIGIGGTKTIAGILDASTSANGIALNGVYSGAQIVGTGWSVSPSGNVAAQSVTVSGNLYVPAPIVPATASTGCAKGQISYDASFAYVCVATNTWKRAALSSW